MTQKKSNVACPDSLRMKIDLFNGLFYFGDSFTLQEYTSRIDAVCDSSIPGDLNDVDLPSLCNEVVQDYIWKECVFRSDSDQINAGAACLHDLSRQKNILKSIIDYSDHSDRKKAEASWVELRRRIVSVKYTIDKEGEFKYEIVGGLTILEDLIGISIYRLGICRGCNQIFWRNRLSLKNPQIVCSPGCGSRMRVRRARRLQQTKDLSRKRLALSKCELAFDHPTKVKLRADISRMEALMRDDKLTTVAEFRETRELLENHLFI